MLFNIFNLDSRTYKTHDFTKIMKKEKNKNSDSLDCREEQKLKINFFE
jgi:hypothetical protein